MMHIQWYPGHMTKAMRMMEENVKLVDSVIYVLDARAIASSFNPSFDRLLKGKTVLYVINKSDLVERRDLDKWAAYFEKSGLSYLTANSVSNADRSRIVDKIRALNKAMLDRYKAKGAIKSVRVMVIGVPNSGKSTLINSLVGKKSAVTGNRPGVTRGKQWVSLGNGVELLDTPGTVWPKFEDQSRAAHLAFIGSIKDDILDVNELAAEILEFFRTRYPEKLTERYGIASPDAHVEDIIRAVAMKRGYLMAGGIPDEERTARAVTDDFRKQRLGKIMLESPSDMI